MANWWLDESPYPGPPDSPPLTVEDYKRAFIHIGSRIAGGYTVYIHAITEAFTATTEAIKNSFGPSLEGYYDHMDWANSTVEERMAYALRRKQNMGTGPRPQWQFGRNGKKVY